MGLDVNRWLKYAKARFDAAVGSGNKKLDDLEARREVERADKPWLSGGDQDSVAPTMDQVRARIEWEAERQGVDAPRSGGVPGRPEDADQPDGPDRPPGPPSPEADPAPGTPAPGTTPTDTTTSDTTRPEEPTTGGTAPRSPQEQADDAEREMARLELEERQRASAQRLEEIRRELGVDAPTDRTNDEAAGAGGSHEEDTGDDAGEI